MLGMPSVFVNKLLQRLTLGSSLVILLSGCGQERPEAQARTLRFYQDWQIQVGSNIAGYLVTNGLGDVGIQLQGKSLYAPYSGWVQAHTDDCVLFSSSQLPAYLFRLCGLRQPRLGQVSAGQAIGAGRQLQFATLRKQPNGTWAFVEPSPDLLERWLKRE